MKIKSKVPSTMPETFQANVGRLSSTLGIPSGETVLGQARCIVLQVYLCVQRMTVTSSYVDCSLEYNISIINQV